MTQSSIQTHSDNPFIFTEIITPKEGHADGLLEIAQRSLSTLRNQPGLLQVMLTKAEKSGGEICTISIWNSKSDFQTFMRTDEFTALLKSEDMANSKEWMREYSMLQSDLVEGWHG